MHRRPLLAAACGLGASFLAGCLDEVDGSGDDEDEPTGSGDESEANGDDGDGFTGVRGIELYATGVEDVPDEIEPIPADDERIEGVSLFDELFELVDSCEEAAEDGRSFGASESPRDSPRAEEARDAMAELARDDSQSPRYPVHVQYEGCVLSVELLRWSEG